MLHCLLKYPEDMQVTTALLSGGDKKHHLVAILGPSKVTM